MRALVFEKKLSYQSNYPVPRPKSNEALIRVNMAGICNTDLEILRGYMEFKGVPGHEFVGVVEKCEEKKWVGKRVTGEINIGCGNCPYCLNRMSNHCPKRSVLGILNKNGAFAEYITLPVRNLHLVPDIITDEDAVFIEPLAAAFEIIQQVKIKSTSKAAILGDGKLGLLVAQVLSLAGCRPIVLGHHKKKLSILEKRGIRISINKKIKYKFDFVVDCTGSATGFKNALNLIKPKGTIILKTTLAKRESVDLNKIVIDEINLIGSRCGPFRPAIQALKKKEVDVRPLISKISLLEDGVDAFKYACQKDMIKIILKC